MKPRINAVMLEVLQNNFMSIAEEMGAVLVKSSYSSNIKERKDCSCAIFDAAGNTIAQAEHMPMHLGSLIGLVEQVLKDFNKEDIHPGDMIIANDPYNGGGTHLPDIAVAAPVFWEDEIIAFVANIAHHNDVGGRVPGSNAADSKTIYEEGIRIPPVKIYDQHHLNTDIVNLVLLNCRVRHIRHGDLKAQFACNIKGRQRVEDIAQRYGKEVTKAAMEEMLDYSERKIRQAIAELPNGKYTFSDYIDSDGVGSNPIKLNLSLEVKDDTLVFDLTDNPNQVAGAINLTKYGALACVYYGVKSILDPSIPSNGGYYRAIHCLFKEGSIIGCKEPAAVAGRSDTAQRLADIIFGAFSQIIPEKVTAGGNSSITGLYFGGVDPYTDEYYVYMETFGGGGGAKYNGDGLNAIQVHMSNSSNLPIESMEIEYPFMVESYSLVPDSGGVGKFRGGLGVRKDIRPLDHNCVFTVKADRQKTPPWGLKGGKDGLPGVIKVNPETTKAVTIDSKQSDIPLEECSLLRCQTPGAGGYGNPLERDRKLVINDLIQGYISKESAINDYGLTEEEIKNI